jgi:hypothetical protein
MIIKKLLVGVLLTFGFLFLMVSISSLFGEAYSSQEKTNTVVGGVGLGLPLISGGLWIAYDMYKKNKQQNYLEIESVFLQLIQENKGVVDPINFAITTKISIDEAKKYLDLKSKQLNGTFEVKEQGGITYIFHF